MEHNENAETSALPEHLQKAWSNYPDPRTHPQFCWKQSKKTPSIPWHNGCPRCLACGKTVHQFDGTE